MSEPYTLVAGQQTDGTWVHTGKLIVSRKLASGTVASVTLPDDVGALADGSVTTAKLAANAAQQLLLSVVTPATWSTTITNQWILTPLNGSLTSGGGLLRIEWSIGLYHSAASALCELAVGWNGTWQYSVAMVNTSAVAGASVTLSGIFYVTLPAGGNTVSIWAANLTAGTLGTQTAVNSVLYVNEQKR